MFLLCFSGYKLIFKKELELEPQSHLFFLHDLVEKLYYGVQQLSGVAPPPSLLQVLAQGPGAVLHCWALLLVVDIRLGVSALNLTKLGTWRLFFFPQRFV